MSGKLKINVVIAGRTYPLSVANTKEEEGMRKAAANINKLISLYEQNYAVNYTQYVLALCALRFASHLEISAIVDQDTSTEALEKIHMLNELLQSHLD